MTPCMGCGIDPQAYEILVLQLERSTRFLVQVVNDCSHTDQGNEAARLFHENRALLQLVTKGKGKS